MGEGGQLFGGDEEMVRGHDLEICCSTYCRFCVEPHSFGLLLAGFCGACPVGSNFGRFCRALTSIMIGKVCFFRTRRVIISPGQNYFSNYFFVISFFLNKSVFLQIYLSMFDQENFERG